MKITRTLLAAVAMSLAAPALAQDYPARPVTLVVPVAAGGAVDGVGRTFAEEIGRRLGQSFVVENRVGAGGTLGAQAVARAKPDGYTLLFTHAAPIVHAPFVMQKVPYDVRKDFVFVSQVGAGSLLLGINASLPVSNVKEFVAWGQKNRGKVSFGDFGVGSNGHLIGAYLSFANDLGASHVSYKGEAPMVQDIAAGTVPWGIGTIGGFAAQIASGRVRPLAVLGERRLPAHPSVPTMAEEGFPDPEYFAQVGIYLMAPAGTPPAILARLEKAAREVGESAAMKARMQTYGLEAMGTASEAARAAFDAARPIAEKLVKVSGARAD